MVFDKKIWYFLFTFNIFIIQLRNSLSSVNQGLINLGKLEIKKEQKMANIKSSKKRILTAERNAIRNVAFKSSIKTALKKALELGTGEDKEALATAVSKVYQLCDKAVGKGILHKNTAARKKSRLILALNKLAVKA